MITGNDIIFIMGPSGAGKTTLSFRLCDMVNGNHVNIDNFFKTRQKLTYALKTYEQELVKEWYNKVGPQMTKYLKTSLNTYAKNRGLNVIDLGGIASFPASEEDLNEYKELVKKYKNFFIILPCKRLCEIPEITAERRLFPCGKDNSLMGAINFLNLSHLNNLYKIFPEYDGTTASVQNRIIYQDDFVGLYSRSEDDHWIEEEIIQRSQIDELNKEIYLNDILNKKEVMQSWEAKAERREIKNNAKIREQPEHVKEE